MGDIYHAGESYAGSVPIDDTQASEDKVYSSAKVETMMEEVQEEIKDYNIIRSVTSAGFSISGNGVADVEVDIPAVSGYTALFAAITGSNLSYMVPIFPCAYVQNASTTKVAFRLRNLDSASYTGRTITVVFFYKRTL